MLPLDALTRVPPPACPPGFHGMGCKQACECQQGAPCDPVSGQCLCPTGFQGQLCEEGECSTLSLRAPAAWCRTGGDTEPTPHQGVSQAPSARAAASAVTVVTGCPATPSVASASAHRGVREPRVS